MADSTSSPRPPPPTRNAPTPSAGLSSSSTSVPIVAGANRAQPRPATTSIGSPSPALNAARASAETEDVPLGTSAPGAPAPLGRPQMRQVHSVANMTYPRAPPPSSPPGTPPSRSGSIGGAGPSGAPFANGSPTGPSIGARQGPPLAGSSRPPLAALSSAPPSSSSGGASPSLQRTGTQGALGGLPPPPTGPPPPRGGGGSSASPTASSGLPVPTRAAPVPGGLPPTGSLPPPPDSASPRNNGATPPLSVPGRGGSSQALQQSGGTGLSRKDSGQQPSLDSRDSLSDETLRTSSSSMSPRDAASPRHARAPPPSAGGAPSASATASRRGPGSANLSDLPPTTPPPPLSPHGGGGSEGSLTKAESKPLKFFGVSSENTGAPTPETAEQQARSKETKEKEKRKWTALFSAAPKGSSSGDGAAESKQSRLLYSERETELLQQIVALIIFKIPGVIVAMYEHTEKERQEALAAAFVNVSFGPSLATLTLLEYLVEDEFVSNLSAGKEILRENGLVIRFLRAYLKCVTADYLQTLLGDFITTIMTDKKLSMEIDPSKASPEELPGNLRELQTRVTALISHMSSKRVLDAMPPGLRMACHYVHEQARKHRPTHTRIYVGSFLMLRFINPALFSPESHGLVPANKPLSAQARRNLILVSKNVSNDVSSSKKEPYMNGLDVGGRWQQALYDWFDELVQVRYNPQSVHEKVTTTPTPEDLHTLHALVFQYRAQMTPALEAPTDRKELDSLLERLGSYQHKESFSFLEDEHNRLVRQLLQARQDEASYLGYIQVQKKAKKNVELVKGILIITRYRILLLAENGKIGADVHQLQLTRIRSSISDHFELIFDDKAILGVSKEVDQIIAIIHRSFTYTFPGMPQEMRFQLDVQPPSRLAHLTNVPLHVEPCDSLVPAYRSVCDLYQVPPVTELCWDLEHLYTTATTLDLTKFTEHYRTPIGDIQALPLLHALGYNRQITTLVLKDVKFQETTFKGLVEMAKLNSTLRAITLKGITVAGKGGSAGRAMLGLFFNEMQANLSLPVTALDLGGTLLDDKGAFALAGFVANLPRSFELLNLRGVVGKADVKTVLDGFKKNPRATSALHSLDWSETKFDDKSGELAEVLAKCPELRVLTLHETGVHVGTLVSKGLRSQTRRLERLDLSHNKFGKDSAWNGLADLLQSNEHCVHELDISDTGIPASVLQHVLMISEGHCAVFAAQNNLGAAGAKVIADIASKITCVDKLDLADNGMGDQGLAVLVEGLCNNQSLTWLRLDNNYKESGDKHRQRLLHQLEMLSNSICPLEVLKFQGSGGRRVGSTFESFLHALSNNTTLTELDVSGHGFGDQGAMALARVLQQNQVLQIVNYDDNQTGTIGFLNLADAIGQNKTLRSMPIPFLDAALLLNGAKDGAEKERISKVLARLDLTTSSSSTTRT